MKLFKYLLATTAVSGFLFSSCTDFEELNTDPTRMEEVNPGTLLNPMLYEMGVYNWERFRGYTYKIMQCSVSNSGTNGTDWWYLSDAAGDGTWSTYYKWINNAKEMIRLADRLPEGTKIENYKAISLTLQAWMFQIVADAFGDVPMTEACSADLNILAPKFDTQESIYRNLIDTLAYANTLFDTNTGLIYNQSPELLYETSNGNKDGVLGWKKFCNSLRMRALMRVIDIPEFQAAEKLQEMLADPETYPVFTSNEDAAMLTISGTYPEEAPLARPQDFSLFVNISEFLVDMLKAWEDPRLPVFATSVTVIDEVTGEEKQDYIGLPSGYQVLPSGSFSALNQKMAVAPMDLAFMTYAEVEFIKAELYQRGLIPGGVEAAREAYEKGVRASVEQWGGELQDGYFENPETAYDGTLERILNQKFVALIFCDYQQWFEYNRTGYPVIPIGPGLQSSGNEMPKRFKYPAVLQRTNLKNYQQAKDNMGGDDFGIKLIWQK